MKKYLVVMALFTMMAVSGLGFFLDIDDVQKNLSVSTTRVMVAEILRR